MTAMKPIGTSTDVRGYAPVPEPVEEIHLTDGTSLAHGVFPSPLIIDPFLFILAALKRARLEQLEDGDWFAEVRECPGAWGKGSNQDECLEDLNRALEEWIRLKLKDRDKDFPVLDGINLNQL